MGWEWHNRKRDAFQSTPPSWEATAEGLDFSRARNISIHASLVGGDCVVLDTSEYKLISIHAPLVGGDYAGSSFLIVSS